MAVTDTEVRQKAAKKRASRPLPVAPAPRGWEGEARTDVFKQICSLIASGQSLRKICDAKEMPSLVTVREWINNDEDLAKQYARAREEQADYYADEITEIADTEPDANKARVRIDARKWVASKLKSKSYGDKVTAEHVGKDGEAIEVRDVSSDARKVAYMLGRAVGRLERNKTDVAQS